MKEKRIIDTLKSISDEGKSMFVTSSFQTHSIPLLHIIAQSGIEIPVYCLNTGFLMPETLAFASEVSKQLGFDVHQVYSATPKHQQRDGNGNFFFTSNPDYCCHINKVEPTSRLLDRFDIWVNGIRADQNLNRRSMKEFQKAGERSMRYHPMLDWSNKEVYDYIKAHNLPRHPLESQGYLSIGCEPCTRKTNLNDPREARWFGLSKTECGLHTELAK
jgi:phosphoadenosine phosphosulfate reductase